MSDSASDRLRFLNEEVRLLAATEGYEQSLSTAFVDYATGVLTERGELVSPIVGEYADMSRRISGIDWDDERRLLTLIVSAYVGSEFASQLDDADLPSLLQETVGFAQAYADGNRPTRISVAAQEVVGVLHEVSATAERVDILIVTDSEYEGSGLELSDILGCPAQLKVMDLLSLTQRDDEDESAARVNISVPDFGPAGLDAVGPFGPADPYEAYLVVIPGDFLADLYEAAGPRLLALNVRSFLQTRGKINRGIQATLKDEPDKFLAYNNGLSITATSVTRARIGGRTVITEIEDLQIVNGGQTTASLYHAKYRANLDLRDVLVQAKLTVLSPAHRAELAPQVSRYANSQNPVRMADFSANDPFHETLETLSRTVSAPDRSDFWFYERNRGQYADELARAGSAAAEAAFKTRYPARQRLLKTDVARSELLWDQRPNTVSLGGEAYFAAFMQTMRERPSVVLPDAGYFEDLVAKTILWQATNDVVTELALGGYKAQTVAYTLALISNRTAQRVDLESVWTAQAASAAFVDAARELAPLVHARMLEAAGARNVSSWAKSEACWKDIQENVEWSPPPALVAEARGRAGRAAAAPTKLGTSLPASEVELAQRARIIAFGAEAWFELSTWAKDTDNLATWQRSIAFSLGRLVAQGKEPSERQTLQGAKILDEAERLGFKPGLSKSVVDRFVAETTS